MAIFSCVYFYAHILGLCVLFIIFEYVLSLFFLLAHASSYNGLHSVPKANPNSISSSGTVPSIIPVRSFIIHVVVIHGDIISEIVSVLQ